MISHAWTVLADKVIIDRDTNNISVDAVEQLTISEPIPPSANAAKPFVIPHRVNVASLWYRSDPQTPAKGKARIRLLAPGDSDTLGKFELDLDLTKTTRLRSRFAMVGLPLVAPGMYFFHVDLWDGTAWTEVSRVPLEVSIGDVVTAGPSG